MAQIAIDLDDTLYSFTAVARQVIAELAAEADHELMQQAAYAPWTEWRTPADMLGSVWLDVINRCHADEIIWNNVPFKGAYEVLWALVEADHGITYISNRDPSTYGATMAWLENNDFPHPGNYIYGNKSLEDQTKLICAGAAAKKPYVADCQYIIDDRPKTLVEFVYDADWYMTEREEYGARKGFGLHTEYNKSLTDVPGIYLAPNWALLGKYLERKGVIDLAKVR